MRSAKELEHECGVYGLPAETCHRPDLMDDNDNVWCPCCGDSWQVSDELHELSWVIESYWNDFQIEDSNRIVAEWENV